MSRLDTLVKNFVSDELVSRGYQRRGRTYRKAAGGAWAIVEFAAQKSFVAGAIRFHPHGGVVVAGFPDWPMWSGPFPGTEFAQFRLELVAPTKFSWDREPDSLFVGSWGLYPGEDLEPLGSELRRRVSQSMIPCLEQMLLQKQGACLLLNSDVYVSIASGPFTAEADYAG